MLPRQRHDGGEKPLPWPPRNLLLLASEPCEKDPSFLPTHLHQLVSANPSPVLFISINFSPRTSTASLPRRLILRSRPEEEAAPPPSLPAAGTLGGFRAMYLMFYTDETTGERVYTLKVPDIARLPWGARPPTSAAHPGPITVDTNANLRLPPPSRCEYDIERAKSPRT